MIRAIPSWKLRAGLEPATFPLTDVVVQNLSAASGVAYRKFGATPASPVALNSAPNNFLPGMTINILAVAAGTLVARMTSSPKGAVRAALYDLSTQ
jgi:hypothetical protein